MITLKLNPKKISNYAYFDPISRLHLTILTPINTVKEMNKNLNKAVKSKSLIVLGDSSKTEDSETVEEKTLSASKEDLKDVETIDETEEDIEDDIKTVDEIEEDIKEDIKEDDDSEEDTKEDGKVACQYCDKEYSPNGVKRHESSCSENPDNE